MKTDKKATQGCPCGYLGEERCSCTPEQIRRYRMRVSGPLLDRIDIHIEVPRLPAVLLHGEAVSGEDSAAVRTRVEAAQARQLTRSGVVNSALPNREVERVCGLDAEARALMAQAAQRLGLSARSFHRILKVARTIADLAGRDGVEIGHLSEALSYRSLDRRALQS